MNSKLTTIVVAVLAAAAGAGGALTATKADGVKVTLVGYGVQLQRQADGGVTRVIHPTGGIERDGQSPTMVRVGPRSGCKLSPVVDDGFPDDACAAKMERAAEVCLRAH